MLSKNMKIAYLLVFFAFLIWSGIKPNGYFIWFLEVAPALIGLAIILATYREFELTGLVYLLILIHCIILIIGGHYTYAEVPLFNWLKVKFELARNNYDKVGHFAQGFFPAIVAREILIRKSVVNGNGWRNFIIVCICLAFSAFYELIEWWVAIVSGETADAFLGTQGYVWDTQSDMALAMIGAILALFLLSKTHDKYLTDLREAKGQQTV